MSRWDIYYFFFIFIVVDTKKQLVTFRDKERPQRYATVGFRGFLGVITACKELPNEDYLRLDAKFNDHDRVLSLMTVET